MSYANDIAPYLNNANYVLSGGVVSPSGFDNTKFLWVYDYELQGADQVSRQYFSPDLKWRLNIYGYYPVSTGVDATWSAYEIYDLSKDPIEQVVQGALSALTSIEDVILKVNDYMITNNLLIG